MLGCSAATRPWSARLRFVLLTVLDCAPPAEGLASELGTVPLADAVAAAGLVVRAHELITAGRRTVRPCAVWVRRVEGTTAELGADVDAEACEAFRSCICDANTKLIDRSLRT